MSLSEAGSTSWQASESPGERDARHAAIRLAAVAAIDSAKTAVADVRATREERRLLAESQAWFAVQRE